MIATERNRIRLTKSPRQRRLWAVLVLTGLFCAARRACSLVRGSPLGRDSAQHGRVRRFPLAVHQRAHLLRQTAWLLLAGARGGVAARRRGRNGGAVAERGERFARGCRSHADRPRFVWPPRRIAGGRGAGHEFWFRRVRPDRVRRHRERRRRTGRAVVVRSQRRQAAGFGPWPVDGDGRPSLTKGCLPLCRPGFGVYRQFALHRGHQAIGCIVR